MRLSALFEEFAQYLKVERGASHRSMGGPEGGEGPKDAYEAELR